MIEEILPFVMLIVLAGFALWLWFRKKQWEAAERMKTLEIRREMIKRFSSAQEFIDFAKTEAGRKLLATEEKPDPRIKLLRLIGFAVTLFLAGGAMLFNGYFWSGYTDINEINKSRDYYYWGSLCIAAGIGVLINTGLMLRLGRQWHVIPKPE